MNLLKWFDKQFTGEVIREYGHVRDSNLGIGRLRTSVLLSRYKNKLVITFRTIGIGLGASANYMHIDATPENLEKLGQLILDAKRELEK